MWKFYRSSGRLLNNDHPWKNILHIFKSILEGENCQMTTLYQNSIIQSSRDTKIVIVMNESRLRSDILLE